MVNDRFGVSWMMMVARQGDIGLDLKAEQGAVPAG
jgi:hypothetical protein